MADGKVVELGTPQELLKNTSGVFYGMHNSI
jgi:ABC-type multidrug transport system fused ATPase/permease subunit